MSNLPVRNWRMMPRREGMAILSGLSVLLGPSLNLDALLSFFAAYISLDGARNLASVFLWSWTHPLEWWRVALEGSGGVGPGVLAVVGPFVFYRVIAMPMRWWRTPVVGAA
jgi:uncharacterized membrane protein HdeD (DUF308 family)